MTWRGCPTCTSTHRSTGGPGTPRRGAGGRSSSGRGNLRSLAVRLPGVGVRRRRLGVARRRLARGNVPRRRVERRGRALPGWRLPRRGGRRWPRRRGPPLSRRAHDGASQSGRVIAPRARAARSAARSAGDTSSGSSPERAWCGAGRRTWAVFQPGDAAMRQRQRAGGARGENFHEREKNWRPRHPGQREGRAKSLSREVGRQAGRPRA